MCVNNSTQKQDQLEYTVCVIINNTRLGKLQTVLYISNVLVQKLIPIGAMGKVLIVVIRSTIFKKLKKPLKPQSLLDT